MGIGRIETLADVREKLLGYSLDGAARLSGLGRERLCELESGERLATVWELEVLSRLYGIDADLLAEQPVHVSPADIVATLASTEEFREIGDATRSHIVATARAARDLVALRATLGEPVCGVTEPISCNRALPAFQQGTEAAAEARRRFSLGQGPIASVRDWVSAALPGVAVLYAALGAQGPAGMVLAAPSFGPTVILNLDGKNRNPCVRRFSLLHELCHLLIDCTRAEPLAQISGYQADGGGREREQRANAFAVRFLCPEVVIQRLPADGIAAASVLISEYGVHYAAARLYLLNSRNLQLPVLPPPGQLPSGTEAKWETAEAPDGIVGFPLAAVPAERRTLVARYAATAYSTGRIQRDAFAEYLAVTPADDVESVLDYFDLDQPKEPASAA